jgi:septation ring formation regulator EzrA
MFAQSLPLLLTLLAIGAGIFMNNKGLSDLKADMKADMKDLKSELKADISAARAEFKSDIARIDTRLNAMQTDLQHFYELKGHLEGRIDEIAKQVAA